jgi:hypothetical protein
MAIVVAPEPGVAVVQLPTSEYGDVPVLTKAHDSLTYGMLLAVNEADQKNKGYLVGRTVYFRKYKDDARLTGNQALIEIKDILGSHEQPFDS